MLPWLGGHLRSSFVVAITFVQFVSSVSANEQTPSAFPRAPSRLDPIGLVIHSLEQRSPADNTSFGAGLGRVALSGDRQYVCLIFFLQSKVQLQFSTCRTYYTVIQVGGVYFRVALDTASADLWLVSSACLTDTCKKVPPYPLTYYSTTFVPFLDNTTRFTARYSDGTCKYYTIPNGRRRFRWLRLPYFISCVWICCKGDRPSRELDFRQPNFW